MHRKLKMKAENNALKTIFDLYRRKFNGETLTTEFKEAAEFMSKHHVKIDRIDRRAFDCIAYVYENKIPASVPRMVSEIIEEIRKEM